MIENSGHEDLVKGWMDPVLKKISREGIQHIHLRLWSAFDGGLGGWILFDIYNAKGLHVKGWLDMQEQVAREKAWGWMTNLMTYLQWLFLCGLLAMHYGCASDHNIIIHKATQLLLTRSICRG